MRKMEWKDGYTNAKGAAAYPPIPKFWIPRGQWLRLWAYSAWRQLFRLDKHLDSIQLCSGKFDLRKPWWTKPSKFYYVNPNGDKSFGIDSATTVK